MSVQNTVEKSEVGAEVQRFIELGSEEILVYILSNGKWLVSGDKKKYWSWLLTPNEVEELQKENRWIRELAEKIKAQYDRYVYYKDLHKESSKEALHQINLYIQKLLL